MPSFLIFWIFAPVSLSIRQDRSLSPVAADPANTKRESREHPSTQHPLAASYPLSASSTFPPVLRKQQRWSTSSPRQSTMKNHGNWQHRHQLRFPPHLHPITHIMTPNKIAPPTMKNPSSTTTATKPVPKTHQQEASHGKQCFNNSKISEVSDITKFHPVLPIGQMLNVVNIKCMVLE